MNFFAALGSLVEGRSQANMQDAQARQADYRANIADLNASMASQQAGAREEAQRRESRQELGRQRAAFAQAGVGFSGSVLDVGRESAISAELDALNTRYAGQVERANFRNEETAERFNAQVFRKQAKSTRRMRWLKAGSSLMGGGGYGG